MRLPPQVWRQDAIRRPQCLEGGLGEIALRARVPAGAGEDVRDAREHHHLLHGGGADHAAASGSRDQAHAHGTALAVDFHRHGVWLSDSVTPITPAERDDVHLGSDDTAADGRGHLFRALCAHADVTVHVADQDVAHEAIALPGRRHLLHGVNLQHFILQIARLEEGIDDLVLLDGQAVEIDLLEVVDLPILHQAAELRHRDPLLLVALALSLLALLALLAFVFALALAFVAEAAAFAEASLAAHVFKVRMLHS